MKNFIAKVWPYIKAFLKAMPTLVLKTKVGRWLLASVLAIVVKNLGLGWSAADISAFLEKLAPLSPILTGMSPEDVYEVLTGPKYLGDDTEVVKQIIKDSQ